MNYIILSPDDWQTSGISGQVDEVIEALGGFKGDLFEGPWIAGGAVRRWVDGMLVPPHSDVDIFTQRSDQYELIHGKYVGWHKTKPGSERLIDTKLQLTFELVKQHFANIGHMFRTFPFTVCQYATDGRFIVTTEEAINDHNNKVLRLPEPFAGKLNREFAAKYKAKGYKADSLRLEDMIANAPERAEFSGD